MPIRLDTLLHGGPGFDEPVEMLSACHERIEDQCETLERLVKHLASNGADKAAREAAQAILRYFDTAGDNHHLDEEEDLFPALREHAKLRLLEVEVLVAALLMEHGRLRQAWREQLRPELTALAEGTSVSIDAAQGKRFIKLYRDHVEREDRELLPLARDILGAGELQSLGKKMAARRGVVAN